VGFLLRYCGVGMTDAEGKIYQKSPRPIKYGFAGI